MKRLFKNKKITILFLAVVVILTAAAAGVFLMRDRLFPQEEEPVVEEPQPVEAPIQYELGENVRILALPAGNNALVYDEEAVSLLPESEEETPDDAVQEEETEGEEIEETEEEVSEEDARPIAAYRYEGMSDVSEMVTAYTTLLTTKDMGFVFANEELKAAKEFPDLEGRSGTAYLTCVFPKSEEDSERQAAAMRIEWTEADCTVTVELVPASVTTTPQTSGFAQVLTFSGAVDTFKAMRPSVLELEGENMDGYRVYSREGVVLINEQPCMRLDVYSYNEALGTNEAAGSYFFSADGLHLYRFDEQEQTVRELEFN